MSIDSEHESSVKSLEYLFTFLKNDPQVYCRFKPDKSILIRMNLEVYIESQDKDERNLALNFTSFLLRYHQDLKYDDFSNDEEVVKKIKRAEMYRNWVDIEDLANGYETLQKNKETSSQAFQEILALVEGVKDELNDKINQNRNQIVNIGNSNFKI